MFQLKKLWNKLKPVLVELRIFLADSIQMSPNFDHFLSNMIHFVEQSVFLKRHRRQLIVDLVALDRSFLHVGLKLKKKIVSIKNLT
jgi:hypothetical protein